MWAYRLSALYLARDEITSLINYRIIEI